MDLLIVCVITQLINTAGTISSHITPDIFLLLQVGFELSRVRAKLVCVEGEFLLSLLGYLCPDGSTEVPEHPGDAGYVRSGSSRLVSPGRTLALSSPPLVKVNTPSLSATASSQVRSSLVCLMCLMSLMSLVSLVSLMSLVSPN